MVAYKLSEACKTDLSNIYKFGIFNFGLNQSRKYLLGLHDCFLSLAENTNMGRSASEFLPKLRRFSYEAHIIFYLPIDKGVLIVRVLNHRMDFDKNLSE